MTLNALIDTLTALRDSQRCGDLDVWSDPAPRRVGGRIELYPGFTSREEIEAEHRAMLLCREEDFAEEKRDLERSISRLEEELETLKGKAK